MEIFPFPTPPRAAKPPTPDYPTMGESWGILGWFLLVSLLVGMPLYLLFNNVFFWPKAATTIVASAISNVALLAFLRWKAGPRWQPLRFGGREQVGLYAALPVLMVASVTVLSVQDLLHLPDWTDKVFEQLMRQPALALLMGVGAAPVLEEILFRGVVLRGLLRTKRPWVAIGQSALLFGLFHLNPAQSLNAVFVGLLLGWLYYRTQSLWVCMAVHALNNLLAFTLMLLVPAARRALSVVDLFHGVWPYVGAVGLGVVVLAMLLRRVQQTTVPATQG